MAEDDNWWGDLPYATSGSAKASATSSGGAGKAKTTPQDMIELREASGVAQSERDAQRTYASTRKAVKKMDTGPLRAAYFDAITPDEDDGWLGRIAGTTLSPIRVWHDPDVLQARDQLGTVSAQTALAGSQQMKGSSSDKDTALMRMAGVGPSKSKGENLRIVSGAERSSQIAQTRALFKSGWIGRFGSIGATSPNGMSFEEGLLDAENRLTHPQSFVKSRPNPAPPSTRKASTTGWSVTEVN